jgi:hypothetical protein
MARVATECSRDRRRLHKGDGAMNREGQEMRRNLHATAAAGALLITIAGAGPALGEPTPRQHVLFSGLLQAHTSGESRAFAPVAMEATGETDSVAEGAVSSEPVSAFEISPG